MSVELREWMDHFPALLSGCPICGEPFPCLKH